MPLSVRRAMLGKPHLRPRRSRLRDGKHLRSRRVGARELDAPRSYRVDHPNGHLDRCTTNMRQILARYGTIVLLAPPFLWPVAERSVTPLGVVVGPSTMAKRVAPPRNSLQPLFNLMSITRRVALVILERSHQSAHESTKRLVHGQLQLALPCFEGLFRFLYRSILPGCGDRQIGALQRILKKAERRDCPPQFLPELCRTRVSRPTTVHMRRIDLYSFPVRDIEADKSRMYRPLPDQSLEVCRVVRNDHPVVIDRELHDL